MKKIQVEETLRRELVELTEQAIFYDAEGRALGVFSPLSELPSVEQWLGH